MSVCVLVMLPNVNIYNETSGYIPVEGARRLKKQNPALKCVDISYYFILIFQMRHFYINVYIIV